MQSRPSSSRDRGARSRWSLPVGSFFGIDVLLHGSLLVLFGVLAVVQLAATGSVLAALVPVAAFAAVLFCVLLHEYGHALVARHFGIGTRSITLLPIGGIAQLERMPEKPREELLVALAGPAVNLALAAIFFVITAAATALTPAFATSTAGLGLGFLTTVNIAIVAFNLLPAFPLDGGRVLRAALAARLGHVRATTIAARVGRTLALAFALVGLFVNPFLVVIALFVWFGAGQEARYAITKSSLQGALVGNAMTTDFHVLVPADDVASVAELSLRTSQRHYPVVSGGTVVGVLLEGDLRRALASDPSARVADFMRRDVASTQPNESLESVFTHLHSGTLAALPVLEDRALVGLITRESIRQFLSLRSLRHQPVAAG